jgi:predicted dienelactone hydrolase
MKIISFRKNPIFIICIVIMTLFRCKTSQSNTSEIETFAGSISSNIIDKKNSLSYPILINYPTQEKSKPTKFGPYTFDVSVNASLKKGKFPLIVISHGNGGSHLIYHTISSYLAKKGFIVVSLEHYGNNRNNNELAKSDLNLKYRPQHISLAIDHLISDKAFSSHIDKDKISIIGHSFGGYSALAIAGGKPSTNSGEKLNIEKDSRINSIVLMAPAAGYFASDSALKEVNTPILLLTAEHDKFTQKKWCEDVIFNGISDKSLITHKEIKNAGHFSFISPFPSHMKNQNFLPSIDPKGFNREEFHKQLPVEIYNYLNSTF